MEDFVEFLANILGCSALPFLKQLWVTIRTREGKSYATKDDRPYYVSNTGKNKFKNQNERIQVLLNIKSSCRKPTFKQRSTSILPENNRKSQLSDVFRRHRGGALVENWLIPSF